MGIEKISLASHVRKRPGMYFGNTSHYGFRILLTNILQELLAHTLNDSIIAVDISDEQIKIRINRFFDLIFFRNGQKKGDEIKPPKELSTQNYIFFSIPISETFEYSSDNGDKLVRQSFKKGINEEYTELISENQNFVEFKFKLDNEIFNNLRVDEMDLLIHLYEYAILNPGVKLQFKHGLGFNSFYFPEGITNLVNRWRTESEDRHLEISINQEIEGFHYEIEFFVSGLIFNKSNISSFANHSRTKYNGTHVNGIISGITEAFKEAYGVYSNGEIEFERILNRLNLCVHVVGNIEYSGNTRERVSNELIHEHTFSLVYEKVKFALGSLNHDARHEFLESFEKGWPWDRIKKSVDDIFKGGNNKEE